MCFQLAPKSMTLNFVQISNKFKFSPNFCAVARLHLR